MAKVTKQVSRMPDVRDSAEQVWLAGLGALAVAEERGSRLFTALVKKGRAVQKAGLAKLDDRMDEARGRVEELRTMPADVVAKIGESVDAGISTVLHRLGVPTRREIGTLTRKVEELTRTLEKKRPAPARSRRTRRTTGSTNKPPLVNA